MNQQNNIDLFTNEEIYNFEVNNPSNKKNKINDLLYAIQVKRLTFSYTDSEHLITILNRLTLNLPLGKIYGLLGPSGCGKTTLIRCILGLIKPESGEIRLFHRRINSKNRRMLQIPGKDVGYMPQDYTLYHDLTVIEQLNYHKALHNVNSGKFATYKIIDTMDLSENINQLVGSLSGGQTRRLSFACALIHKPRLLILDEPTVGVDPLLRQRIWKILTDYVTDCRASVLITTHYIEETRKAQIVGFMRRGHLLVEDNPNTLIKKFKASNLEEVFYKLCIKQKKQSKLWKRTSLKVDAIELRRRLDLQLKNLEYQDVELDTLALNEMLKEEAIRQAIEQEARKTAIILKRVQNNVKKKKIDILLKLRRPIFLIQIIYWFHQLSVVIKRIFKQTIRQKAALFAQFILPLLSIILFCVCVGETPKDIKLAIFNEELKPNLSLAYLNKLNPEIITQINFNNYSEALNSVRKGHNWGILRIPENFSTALIERAQYQAENLGDELTNETINQSTLVVHADLTNKVLMVTIQRSLDLSLREFLNETLVNLGYKSNLLSLPLKLQEIIYGSFYSTNSDNYYALKDYGISGILIILNYTMAFGLTVLVLTEETKNQMIERNFVIGISSTVIILAHLFVRILLCNLNVAVLLYVSLQLFYAPITVSIKWAFLLLITQCLTGLTHGMLISAICTDFFMAAVLSNGILLMMFILSGVLWPVESLPNYLKFLSFIQPTTIPTESLRWMLSRGHNISEPKVYNGFIVSGVYFFIFFILAAIIFNKKKSS